MSSEIGRPNPRSATAICPRAERRGFCAVMGLWQARATTNPGHEKHAADGDVKSPLQLPLPGGAWRKSRRAFAVI